jgi:hypothetical protein
MQGDQRGAVRTAGEYCSVQDVCHCYTAKAETLSAAEFHQILRKLNDVGITTLIDEMTEHIQVPDYLNF